MIIIMDLSEHEAKQLLAIRQHFNEQSETESELNYQAFTGLFDKLEEAVIKSFDLEQGDD